MNIDEVNNYFLELQDKEELSESDLQELEKNLFECLMKTSLSHEQLCKMTSRYFTEAAKNMDIIRHIGKRYFSLKNSFDDFAKYSHIYPQFMDRERAAMKNLSLGRKKGTEVRKNKAKESHQIVITINNDLINRPRNENWTLEKRAQYIAEKTNFKPSYIKKLISSSKNKSG